MLKSRLYQQFLFMKKYVPFYKEYYNHISLNPDMTLVEMIQELPLIYKSQLKQITPYENLVESAMSDPPAMAIHRFTGGTTGFPISIFYSRDDWSKALQSHKVFFESFFKLISRPILAYNNYNQNHISGPVFSQSIMALGGLAIDRSFNASDKDALNQIVKHRCNVIITPPISTKKGGTFEDLLNIDASQGINYINGDNVDIVIFSSTPASEDIYAEIKALNIPFVINCYGSTEVMPIAISCPYSDEKMHVIDNNNQCSVVDEKLHAVSQGERGLILTGRVGYFDSHDVFHPSMSTSLLNFVIGDEAIISNSENCPCGRSGSMISKINRVIALEDKLKTGCQIW